MHVAATALCGLVGAPASLCFKFRDFIRTILLIGRHNGQRIAVMRRHAWHLTLFMLVGWRLCNTLGEEGAMGLAPG